ncbi:MAG: cellulase family glycosylhydrolase [Clostridia bacterium]|nr:cellulase family glycosylhydrolase [Clostridia bacterium]
MTNKDFPFQKGMGIGGWLTNYKRFNVLPDEWRMKITVGDIEHFQTYITEWDVQNIKKMGFDHIRVGFDQIVMEETPFCYREVTMNLLTDFIKWCDSNGLGTVLNLHKSIGNYCDITEEVTLFESQELQDRVTALWLEIEKRMANYPNVAFELLNEVRDINPELWNDLAERIIKEIRKINPTRIIIVGSTCWNSPDRLKDLRIFDDEYVAYTYHTYSPFEFTHQRGVLMASPLYYNRKMYYPSDDIERYRDYHRLFGSKNPYSQYDRIDAKFLEDCMQGAIQFTKAHPDKVLWNGEFGTIRHADKQSRINYMRDTIQILKKHGIPYSVWNYLSTPNDGNRFSLVDDDTREILSEDLLQALLGN